MADKIRILIETMMPDLLALNRKKVFSKKQIKEILHSREELEYGLAKKNVTLKEYYKAIEFEYALEKSRRKAFETLKITKHNYRDYSIIRRIIQLYDRVTYKYKYNISLWKEYLGFCYTIHSKKLFFKAVTHALSYNAHNLDLWLLSVYYEFDINKSPFKARKIFFKALEINPKEKNFWREYFRFEIKFAEMLLKRKKILETTTTATNQAEEKMVEEPSENPDFIPFSDAKDDKFVNSENELKLTKDFLDNNKNNLEVIKAVFDTAKEGISSKKEAAIEYLEILEDYLKDSDWLLEVKNHILEDIKDDIPNDVDLNLAVFKTLPKLPYLTGDNKEQECKNIKTYISVFLKKHLKLHSSIEKKIELLEKFLEYINEEMLIKNSSFKDYELEHKRVAFTKLGNVCSSFMVKQNLEKISEAFTKNFVRLFKTVELVEHQFRDNLLGLCDSKFKQNTELFLQVANLLACGPGNPQEFTTLLRKKFAKESIHFNKSHRLELLKMISNSISRENSEDSKILLLKDLFQFALETILLHKSEFSEFFDHFYDLHLKSAESLGVITKAEEFVQKLTTLNQSCPSRAYLIQINNLKNKKGSATTIQNIFKKLVQWFPREKSVWLNYIQWETERENGRVCVDLFKSAKKYFPNDPDFSEEYMEIMQE